VIGSAHEKGAAHVVQPLFVERGSSSSVITPSCGAA
jgi:hypothetical protein